MQTITLPIHSLRHSTLLALFAGSTLVSGSAWAQSQEAGENVEDSTRDDSGDYDRDDSGDSNRDDDDGMEPQINDTSDTRPEPPGGTALDDDGNLQDPEITKSAGMGSDDAYATRGVIELGGSLGLDIREELIDFVLAPTVGYFIADRFEISLIPILTVQRVGDPDSDAEETNVRVAVILEPSYHQPLTDSLYVFGGVGFGVAYEEGPGTDFLLRPVLGLDIMIGRSGILKPAGFVDIGFGDGAIGGGLLAGYTVMF